MLKNVPLAQRLMASLASSSFFALSLTFHLVLVAVAGSVVLFKVSQPPTAFEIAQAGSFIEEEKPGPLPEELTPQEFDESPGVATPAPPSPPAQSTINSLSSSPANWATPASFNQISIGSSLSSAKAVSLGSLKNSSSLRPLDSSVPRSSFSFMGIRSESRRTAFLLDASGSMILDDKGGGEAYAKLKEELISLVDGMDPGTEFNVVMFGAGADLFQPAAVKATDENVKALRAWLAPYMREKAGLQRNNYSNSRFNGLRGSTRLDLALTAALEMQAETFFILTDGTPSVRTAADSEVLEKWEAERNKEENKRLIAQYEEELKEYYVKFKEEYDQAVKKAQALNNAVQGRDKETYNWTKFAPNFPTAAPPFYHKPHGSLSAKDINRMLKQLHLELYAPHNLPMPTINVIGYYLDDASEEYLKEMTSGIPHKHRIFKK